MHLLPREEAKVLLHQVSLLISVKDKEFKKTNKTPKKLIQVGFIAQKRLARGVKLNQTEAVALIASVLQERIRDGRHSVAELMQHGKKILGRRHVLRDVPSLLHDIQVEGTFLDGYALRCTYPYDQTQARSS